MTEFYFRRSSAENRRAGNPDRESIHVILAPAIFLFFVNQTYFIRLDLLKGHYARNANTRGVE